MRTLGYAVRQLRQSPGFTGAAILALALGIGTTTAMFAVMDGLLFRPLPVRGAERLVRIGAADTRGSVGLPAPLRGALRREAIFDGLCGFLSQRPIVVLTGGAVASRWTQAMTGDCFTTLGVTAALGRTLEPGDDLAGAPRVAVLGYDLWQREFQGRADVLGRTALIDGVSASIVGVSPRGFGGLLTGFPAELIFSLPPTASANTFARLKGDETVDRANARLRTVWPRLLEQSVPSTASGGASRARVLSLNVALVPAATGFDRLDLRGRFGAPSMALLGVASLVLLVACVNVASLLMARGMMKKREASVRLALGAGRWRLLRDAMVESALLLAGGIGLGVALAYGGSTLLVSLIGGVYAGFLIDVTPDARTLLFCSGIALVTFLIFAIVPALKNSRADGTALLAGAASKVVGQRAVMRRALVVAQFALTLVLLTGAALFVSTLANLRGAPLGLTSDGVLLVGLTPLPGAYSDLGGEKPSGGPGASSSPAARAAAPDAYYRGLIDDVRRLDGVTGAALARVPPLSARSFPERIADADAPERTVNAEVSVVTDGYLRALGIPLVAGRDFHPSDRQLAVRTAIVSESFANKLFAGRDVMAAIGARIQVGDSAAPREIIGIARDSVLTDPRARHTVVIYDNFWQASAGLQQWPTMVIKTTGPSHAGGAAAVVSGARRVVRDAGREHPDTIRTLAEERDASLVEERLLASLSTVFGWAGLALAGIGLYSVLAFSVTRRTGEIGVRMALGARRSQIVRLVLREALVSIAAGAAIGLPLALAGARAVRTLLYGVGALDLGPLAAAMGILAIVGLIAAWIPARRAGAVSPCDALRSDK